MPRNEQLPPLSGSSMQLLLQFGLDHGLSVDRCLAGTGLDWRNLADPALVVGADQELQLIRNLAEALDHIPGVGIQAGLRYRLASRGVWGFALLSCTTLRDAIAMAFRYQSLWNPLTIFRVEEDGDLLTTTSTTAPCPQTCGHSSSTATSGFPSASCAISSAPRCLRSALRYAAQGQPIPVLTKLSSA